MGQAAVAGKTFYVHLAGKTNGAHQSLVAKLEGVGYIKVSSPEKSAYILVFCPVASRVGTDISEATDNMPGYKPVILVVMHHTFNRDHVVADSSRQVNHPNVHLTVDCLFFEGRLLDCNRNENAWFDIQTFLGVSASQVSTYRKCYYWLRNHPWRAFYRRKCCYWLRNHPWRAVVVFVCAGIVLGSIWWGWSSG